MKSLKFILICAMVFLFSFLSTKSFALTMMSDNFNASYNQRSLSMEQIGALVKADCVCPPLDPFCWWECTFGSGNYTWGTCFPDDQPLWLSSYAGANGVLYFNNTCDITNYITFGIYAEQGGSKTFTNPNPTQPMTIYAQIKYRVSTWSGANLSADRHPFFAFIDASTLDTLPAQTDISTGSGWRVETIWTTFPAGQELMDGMILPEWNNMPSGWKIYIDYFRVGYLDHSEYRDANKNSSQRMADCGWSAGTTGWRCGASGTLWDEELNRSVQASVSTYRIGDDPNTDNATMCQTFWVNHSAHPEAGTGTYVVRIPMEMSYGNFSSDTGEFYYSVGGLTSATNIDAEWCYFLAKDYFYHHSRHYYFTWRAGFGTCSSVNSNAGWIDYLGVNNIRHSSFGYTDTGRIPLSPYWGCGCVHAPDCYDPPPCPNPDAHGGNLCFAYDGTPDGCISMANMTYESANLTWVNDGTTCDFVGGGQKYFRHKIPDAYMTEWNITGNQWKINNWGVSGNNEKFTMGDWLDGEFFFFGENQPDMYNVTCDEGWFCENDEEFYQHEDCDRFFETDCGACGCLPTGDRCRIGEDHWECHGLETWHYNVSCLPDLELLCDIGCDNETGMCEGEINCITTDECTGTEWCNETSGIFYEEPFCNTTTYACDYVDVECTYGCAGYGCLGIPNEPVFTNQTPQAVISEVTGGILGFLSASGSGIFNTLFLLFVIVFIISIFSLVAYFIKKGFSH